MHGHSFKVEVSVEGDVNPATGWFYDHAVIGRAMRPLVEQLDHAYLNDIPGLENPTSKTWRPGSGVNLRRIAQVWRRSSFTKLPPPAAAIAAVK
jgi:6-pyruvoyl-tetrahydropterin synthase